MQPSDLLSQLSGKRKWCFDTEKHLFLCEPLKCAAIVWFDESKILMEGTPVAINQGWYWQAPGVPGLNSRKTDSCWLIRLTRPHENANYLWIVLLSCEDQSNIYTSVFQYSSIPNTWCNHGGKSKVGRERELWMNTWLRCQNREEENMTDSRGDRLIMNQCSLLERNKMKYRSTMACCSSNHTCYQYVHAFPSISLRANCCFNKVCKRSVYFRA